MIWFVHLIKNLQNCSPPEFTFSERSLPSSYIPSKNPDRFETQYVCTYLRGLFLYFALGNRVCLVPRVLSLPPFYFTSSAVTMFFYVMRRVADWLNLTCFLTFTALHWKRNVSKDPFQFIGVTRLSGYMGVLLHFWLLGATWLRDCMAMWLPSYVAAWLPTCLRGSYAARLLSGVATWILPRLHMARRDVHVCS